MELTLRIKLLTKNNEKNLIEVEELVQNCWAQNKYPQTVTHILVYNIHSRNFSARVKKPHTYKRVVFLHLVYSHMRKNCKEGNKNVLLSYGMGKTSVMPFNICV